MIKHAKMKLLRGSCVLALSLALSLGAACGKAPSADETQVPTLAEPVGVKQDTVEVRLRTVSEFQVFSAYVRPETELLQFGRDGILADMVRVPGSLVKAGDILAELRRGDIETELAAARAELEEMTLSQAESVELQELLIEDLEVRQAAWQASTAELVNSARGPITKAAALKLGELELGEANKDLQALQETQAAALAVQTARVAELEASLEASFLRAPADGRLLGFADLQPGQYVRAEDAFAEMVDESVIYLESEFIAASLLEEPAAVLARIGTELYPVTAREFDYGSVALTDEGTDGLRLQFDFDDGLPEGVQLGDLAQIEIETRRLENVLTVPVNALYRGGGATYVYRLNGEERERVEVEIQPGNAAWAVIASGLEEGDVIYVQDK